VISGDCCFYDLRIGARKQLKGLPWPVANRVQAYPRNRNHDRTSSISIIICVNMHCARSLLPFKVRHSRRIEDPVVEQGRLRFNHEHYHNHHRHHHLFLSSLTSLYTTYRDFGDLLFLWSTYRNTKTIRGPSLACGELSASALPKRKRDRTWKKDKHRNTQSVHSVEEFSTRKNPIAEPVIEPGSLDQ
jgi:hypothetical protein